MMGLHGKGSKVLPKRWEKAELKDEKTANLQTHYLTRTGYICVKTVIIGAPMIYKGTHVTLRL